MIRHCSRVHRPDCLPLVAKPKLSEASLSLSWDPAALSSLSGPLCPHLSKGHFWSFACSVAGLLDDLKGKTMLQQLTMD